MSLFDYIFPLVVKVSIKIAEHVASSEQMLYTLLIVIITIK